MCLCCCTTRFSILVYMIIISALALIYGIVSISIFGSSTKPYKILMLKIEAAEKGDTDPTNERINQIQNQLNKYGYNGISNLFNYIPSITKDNYKLYKYDMIKRLKGIEHGLGIVLFIFPGIFLGVEILFLIYICGIKEYQILPTTLYKIFNIIRIICITLSTIFIFLSVLYSSLLSVALRQYAILTNRLDVCFIGILVGIIDGGYCFWFYIVLACAFCSERQKFVLVGSEQQPGADAKYDLNGNPLVLAVPVTSTRQPQMNMQNNQIQLNPNDKHPLDGQFYHQAKVNQQYNVEPSSRRNVNNPN